MNAATPVRDSESPSATTVRTKPTRRQVTVGVGGLATLIASVGTSLNDRTNQHFLHIAKHLCTSRRRLRELPPTRTETTHPGET